MLYATTRSKVEIYTSQRALKDDRAPDGGLFIPAQVPALADSEIMALGDMTPGAAIADVMNRFWGCKLSQWDVEFQLGKRLYDLTDMSHRIVVAQLWKNPKGSLEALESTLTELISVEAGVSHPGAWMRVTVRIGLLFAIFGELQRRGTVSFRRSVDVAVATGDFISPFAAWYARRMGLPIGTVVCCCNENGGIWDLLSRGQMRLGGKVVHTTTPKCDTLVPDGLEWLIYAALDRDETAEFLQIREKGGLYELNKEQHNRIRKDMYASVSSDKRLSAVMPNVFNTNGFVLCPYSAMVYSGLMDYRSVTGQRRPALMLVEHSPVESAEQVTAALGISEGKLRDILNIM